MFDSDSKELTSADIENQVEVLSESLEDFCQRLEESGIDPVILNCVLLTVYCDRMAALGDRDLYEEQLDAALEDAWEPHTIH